ncbi:MAG TPA: molybdate ABC transporter substrate-binding protein [Eoetvoesiella sp.]
MFCLGFWPPMAAAGEVLVSAASSLTNAFKAVAEQFQSAHPGSRILLNFGASDVVLQQIINGAPVDVFASADQTSMDKAVAAKAVQASTRVDFAQNEVVMIVPGDSELGIRSLSDLNKVQVKRIALGNPASVPVGRYTEASLKQAGAWRGLQDKLILAQNVRQALDYVTRGEVDAGFVFATDAAIMPAKVKVVQRLASPTPVLYPIALASQEVTKPETRQFLAFILSPEGQAILAKYGFKQP